MPVRPSVPLDRAASAFTSFAVTVALAAMTVLFLAFGFMQPSKAEMTSTVLLRAQVEDSFFGLDSATAGRAADAKSQVVLRRTGSEGVAVSQGRVGLTQEWLGMSKVAFPLLVADLAGGRQVPAVPAVMIGPTVGAIR